MDYVSVEELLFSKDFNILYLVLFFISLILMIEIYIKKHNTFKIQMIFLIIFCIAFALLFGFRNFEVGVDTLMYIGFYQDIGIVEMNDKGFDLLMKIIRFLFGTTDRAFVLSVASLYMFTIYLFIRISKFQQPFIFFFCWASLFFFKSMGMNTIRQGIAANFFMLSLVQKKKVYKYILMVLSFTVHASMIIPIVGYFITKYLKNVKYYLVIYLLGAILSIAKFNIFDKLSSLPGLGEISQKRGEAYASVTKEVYNIGFRPDFFFFNSIFAIIGYAIYINKNNENENYSLYYSNYLLLSALFFLMFNVGFSDRYGFLSWIYIPLLIAPIFENYNINMKLINKLSIYALCFILAFIFYFIK